VIIGEPSLSLVKQIDDEARSWLDAVKVDLGEYGLRKKAEDLAAAEKANQREIPVDLLTDFPLSDSSKIEWLTVETGINSSSLSFTPVTDRVQVHLDDDAADLPYLVHFSHVESKFLTVRAMLDTSVIPPACRPYVRS
jgi:Zn-dependent M16 (insulinase) family peptidase